MKYPHMIGRIMREAGRERMMLTLCDSSECGKG